MEGKTFWELLASVEPSNLRFLVEILCAAPPISSFPAGLRLYRVRHELGHAHDLLLTPRLSTVYSFVAIRPAYLQESIHTIYTEGKKIYIQGHSQTRRWLALNLSCIICCFWSKLYWTNSAYLAHTLIILCNNNTTVPGSSCSQRSGFASVEMNKARPQILFMCVDVIFCGLHLFSEGRVPHPLHAPLSTWSSFPPRSLAARMEMLVLKRAVYQFRCATHVIHIHNVWPCWEPTETHNPGALNYFLCSYRFF